MVRSACLLLVMVQLAQTQLANRQLDYDIYDDMHQFPAPLFTIAPRLTTSTNCPPDHLLCFRSYPPTCIPKSFFCDNERDCQNGEDETNCPATLLPVCDPKTQRRCDEDIISSPCVAISQWCDGDVDCFFGEDEVNCSTPAIQSTNISTKVDIPKMAVTMEGKPQISVVKGNPFNLTCIINVQGLVDMGWVHVEHNHVIAKKREVFDDVNKFSAFLSGNIDPAPASVNNLRYTLSVKNASYDDAGVYACKVFQTVNGSNVTVTQYANVFIPGAPLYNNHRNDFDDAPLEAITRPKNNEACCRSMNVTSDCVKRLCMSSPSDASNWEMPAVKYCMSHVASGLLCLSGNHFSLPCCIRSNVSERCQAMCQKQKYVTSESYLRLVLDCMPQWPQIMQCFSETNRLIVDPPFGVSARAVSNTSIAVSWMPPGDAASSANFRYAVFMADVNPNDIDLEDNDYKRLGTTADNNYLIKNLASSQRYAVFVMTIAPSGIVSARSSTVEAITYPDQSITSSDDDDTEIDACCERRKVSPQCASHFCTLNHTAEVVQSVVSHALDCSSDVKPMFSCLAGSHNHSSCCLLRHVPRNCLDFCIGHLSDKQLSSSKMLPLELECLPHIGMMAACFIENRGRLPNPPQSLSSMLSFNTLGSSPFMLTPAISATVSWQPPKPLASRSSFRTDVKRYRLTLTSPGAGSQSEFYVGAAQNRYIFTQPFADIRYDSMYIVRVAAENSYGMSLDVATSFSTPSPASVMSGEQLSPTIGSSMRVCCEANGMAPSCVQSCKPNVIRTFANLRTPRFNQNSNCVESHWRKYAYCGSMQTDVTPCCKQKYIPPSCLAICNMTTNISLSANLSQTSHCVTYMAELFSCVEKQWSTTQFLGMLSRPFPPTDLRLLYTSFKGMWVTITWRPPSGGVSFVDYIVAIRPDGSNSEVETQISARLSTLDLENLVPKTTYWVRMYTVTHQGVRSNPSASISFTTLPSSGDANVEQLDSSEKCCAKTSVNCRPFCTSLTKFHNSNNSMAFSACPKDVVAITRCSILALKSVAADVGKPEKGNISACCQEGSDAVNKSCCVAAFTLAELQSPIAQCNTAQTLSKIRNCIWRALTSLGPSEIRSLSVHNVTATTARLTWLPPLYNSDNVSTYTANCTTWIKKNSVPWESDSYESELGILAGDSDAIGQFNKTTQETETSINFTQLMPGAMIRCSLSSLTKDPSATNNVPDQMIEFETRPESYNIKLTVRDQDSLTAEQMAEMDCDSNEVVFTSLKWYFAPFGNMTNIEVPRERVDVNATVFRIPALKPQDSGTYTCEVNSLYANHSFRASAAVTARSLPEAIIPRQNITCDQSCQNVANCTFTGFPDEINWHRLLPSKNVSGHGSFTLLGFSKSFIRSGTLTTAFMPSYAINLSIAPKLVLRAVASNLLGSAICEIGIQRDPKLIEQPKGWRYVPTLCELVSQQTCCSIVDPSCARLCSFAQRCADSVPEECLFGFQRCKRIEYTPPDITERNFNLTQSTVMSYFNDSMKTRLSYSWLANQKPNYAYNIDYYLTVESVYDPYDLGKIPVDSSGFVDLYVPHVPYEVSVFAENEIGDRSVNNFTKTITSAHSNVPLPFVTAGREGPSTNNPRPGIQIVWFWPFCHQFAAEIGCLQAYIFYRPVTQQKQQQPSPAADPSSQPMLTAVDKFSHLVSRENLVIISDVRPDSDYILLACVGESMRRCIFSEPFYLSVSAASLSARSQSSGTASSTVIGLSVVFALALVVILALVAYFFGPRLLTYISTRISSKFVFYHQAGRGEPDGGAIIFEDFAATSSNAVEID